MFSEVIESTDIVSKSDRLRARRSKLLSLIKKQHPSEQGEVIFFAPTESDHDFLQDSYFFYFSEIEQPSVVLTFAENQSSILFQPNFGNYRQAWLGDDDRITECNKKDFAIDTLQDAGKLVNGYSIYPYFSADSYAHVIEFLCDLIARKQKIFTIYPSDTRSNAAVRQVLDRLAVFIPGLMNHIIDVSNLAASLRRRKDAHEIEMIYQAISVTHDAFLAAESLIKQGATEAQIHAAMQYIFIEQGARPAYHPIVAAGNNSTILHYHANNAPLQQGELLLIDAGAQFNHYCSDITRMFAISNKMNNRQAELYQILLDTQAHVATHARAGVWLSNPQQPEKSLQHIAIEFLRQHKLDQYFTHGIGHYLGLDTHDVGSRSEPLMVGDVITIEPGIYIPQEKIGLRIEDNYWILQDDALCMSEDIKK